MVAMVITLVAMLGLLKAVEMADEQSLRTAVRDELLIARDEWCDQVTNVVTSRRAIKKY